MVNLNEIFIVSVPTDILLKIQLGMENSCGDCRGQEPIWILERMSG